MKPEMVQTLLHENSLQASKGVRLPAEARPNKNYDETLADFAPSSQDERPTAKARGPRIGRSQGAGSTRTWDIDIHQGLWRMVSSKCTRVGIIIVIARHPDLLGPFFSIGNEHSRIVHKSGVFPEKACARVLTVNPHVLKPNAVSGFSEPRVGIAE